MVPRMSPRQLCEVAWNADPACSWVRGQFFVEGSMCFFFEAVLGKNWTGSHLRAHIRGSLVFISCLAVPRPCLWDLRYLFHLRWCSDENCSIFMFSLGRLCTRLCSVFVQVEFEMPGVPAVSRSSKDLPACGYQTSRRLKFSKPPSQCDGRADCCPPAWAKHLIRGLQLFSRHPNPWTFWRRLFIVACSPGFSR